MNKLEESLGEAYPSWRDTARIRGGQHWREEIVRAIDAAYALILIVSPETEHSREVYAEYFYALGHEVPVIPVLVAKCDLPFGQENVNARLWFEDPKDALQQIKEDLDHYRHKAPAAEVLSEEMAYLNALQFDYLLHVENYTHMAGVAKRHVQKTFRRPQAVVMRPDIHVRRSSPLFEKQQVQAQEEVRDYEDLLPALHELKRTVVLGEPGIGKTTSIYKFADELRQQALAEDGSPLPVIVPLREWQKGKSWQSFIDDHLGGLAPRYRELLEQKRLYFLFDGLNELPRDTHRDKKLAALRGLFEECDQAVVTCRELDYRNPTLQLQGLNTITISPLTPEQIQTFLSTYLRRPLGEEEGSRLAQALFWQIAGGDRLRDIWKTCEAAGVELDQFFKGPDAVAQELLCCWEDEEFWRNTVEDRGNLIRLAANPYLLWILLNLYLDLGYAPDNRGALFEEFVFNLLKYEKMTAGDQLTVEGEKLISSLGRLAWHLQGRVNAAPEIEGAGVTVARDDAVTILGDEDELYRAASASLLEDARPVRFTHQLLQEYFAARRLLEEINNGLRADELWPATLWWDPTGWEEIAVLATGMGGREVIDWLLTINPELAAMAINQSGRSFDDNVKLMLRDMWLPRLTDVDQCSEAAARASIGRALGSIWLEDGAPLDNRPGVGLDANGIPDIEWVEISGGAVDLEGIERTLTVNPFRIARCPVTNIQFQAFIDDEDGYRNPQWWQGMKQGVGPRSPEWNYANHPRDTVNWYEAVAFCRWLTEIFGLEENQKIRLPTEWEWQQAATGGESGNTYPWGGNWDATRCNSSDSQIGKTTAVGIYPHGTWAGGPMDIAGNVEEWCLNKHDNPKESMACRIDDSFDVRVFRGGSWYFGPKFVRSAYRNGFYPGYRHDHVGFRLAKDIE